MINAANIQSEISRREAAGEFDREQAAKLRRLASLNAPAALAEMLKDEAQRKHAEAETEKTIEEMVRARKRYTVPNPFKPSEKVELSASEFATYIGNVETRGALARERYLDNVRQAQAATLAARKDERSRLQAIDEAETNILATKPDMRASAEPLMNFVNRESDNPYVWIYFPDVPGNIFRPDRGVESQYDEANTKVPIPPTASGAQPRAKDIYEDAEELGLSVKQYMEQIYFPKKVGRPAPWLPR